MNLKEASHLLKINYNIKGVLTELPGEVDLNYKVETNHNVYVFKITKNLEDVEFIDFQNQLLSHLNGQNSPKVINDINGSHNVILKSKNGEKTCLRLLTWIFGRVWSSVNPNTDELRLSLGEKCGTLTKSLQKFDHRFAHREFEWDIAKSIWVEKYLDLFKQEEKKIISNFLKTFKKNYNNYNRLRKGVVHNDANDNNIIVDEDNLNPRVLSLIDFGDAIHTQIINDVAIACAYGIMNFSDPLQASISIIKGYNSKFKLQEKELSFLYNLVAMRLIVSVTKSAINKSKNSSNQYLWISEKPAWDLLKKWIKVDSEFAYFQFREACGYLPHPNYENFSKWSSTQKSIIKSVFPTINKNTIYNLDLSVSSNWIGRKEEFNDLDHFQFKIDQIQKIQPDKIIAGGYLEPRVLYTSNNYKKEGNVGLEKRCLHLGVDFWVPYKTPIHAFIDGTVEMMTNEKGEKTYGVMLILKHEIENLVFYTLYGHLSFKTFKKFKKGDKIKRGDNIGWIGDSNENGNWVPHLHFQILLSLLNFKNDFPGVVYYSQKNTWKFLCPDPNLLIKSKNLDFLETKNYQKVLNDRKKYLGKGMSLQYNDPLHIVRGEGVFLIDQNGRYFMDMVNNVAHVGHENYNVVKAGQLQMAQLNTNTRYINQNIINLAKRITSTLPSDLCVVHFVNSGSEAVELAIRMIKTVTGSNQILASQYGYHGNTNSCIDISSYKFDGKGGKGKPENTFIFPIPDSFRGKYRGRNTTSNYVLEIKKQIQKIHDQKKRLGGIIIEPIISCGGQIELPKGFLARAFDEVRKSSGLCVVDEVQTGCGRVGSHFWGFQLHNVIPDIITIGKPLGNGHPVAAVVCTKKVAEAFNNGMEFFNTFGGNPVSCSIADEVLKIVSDENLQENALLIGNYLKNKLEKLLKSYPFLACIRGQGLFLGIELVDKNLKPLPEKADYLINRLKYFGILLSTDGPNKNVIKIKPPLVFSIQNANFFLKYFELVLNEDFMIN